MRHETAVAAVMAFTSLALLIAAPVQAQAPSDILSITYISMGGPGDSTLIQMPDGSNILVDAGDRFNSRYQEVKAVLEQNSIDTIHLAIATHGDSDHIGGFNHLLEDADYAVESVWFIDTSKTTATVATFLERSENVRTQVSAGHERTFGSITIEVLSPPAQGIDGGDENANSIVSLLEYGSLDFMFTGDATEETERWLVENIQSDKLDIDIMNAPHHGSATTSNTQEFIAATSPELVIYSADDQNRHGHPHQGTIDRYTSSGISQLQTGTEGNILIQTDGTKCSVIFTNGTEAACFEGVLKLSEQGAPPDEDTQHDEGGSTRQDENGTGQGGDNTQGGLPDAVPTHTVPACR